MLRHHVTTLAATSSQPNPKTLALCELQAHLCAMFQPYICELRGDAVAVAAVLIGYGGVRSLRVRGRGGGNCDRLLPLHHCSDSSSAALRVFLGDMVEVVLV
jgi:hypothetical protein